MLAPHSDSRPDREPQSTHRPRSSPLGFSFMSAGSAARRATLWFFTVTGLVGGCAGPATVTRRTYGTHAPNLFQNALFFGASDAAGSANKSLYRFDGTNVTAIPGSRGIYVGGGVPWHGALYVNGWVSGGFGTYRYNP